MVAIEPAIFRWPSAKECDTGSASRFEQLTFLMPPILPGNTTHDGLLSGSPARRKMSVRRSSNGQCAASAWEHRMT